ncbi:MAG: bifunctional DNA-formamidopyrimidine glycosylase/DNA-(apurinic or apyrimidinic site) lyase [Gammaproteobacteria bacterium]|nr:bifunctional DNA-formamidopyrimidine glycosylase/DNA-(apurinic or apyrimidinic site) lyase [Gammaproteobacteria bacterium]MDH5240578.1 bifunctional DNA-formamidopyrimidine glycosylase/DNA-(apurinic or apyrimidinic site) lyase [Gammaproteobacteria bacterium]MDH5261770.1 bifunctional DNA-formamidopyrimidine glycosylase/DNA-(apurinic or apyrimidinic site) lyase [Gammaproteobacteria bacterium]MDH5583855.1 bifunctional DNA-formamidopyrimidine glycosylase/DNA-(apurinic or apyrimidinic site) lyase [
MPELPEVETSRRGIEPHILDTRVTRIIIRNRRLRWPVSKTLDRELPGNTITSVTRRAKYLLINTSSGTAILHLGMSGSVFVVDHGTPAGVHDHVDIDFDSGKTLRFRDPRRFGSLHWSTTPLKHKLLVSLGPEPLDDEFNAIYLWQRSRGRRVSIKQFIMNAAIVVGVGNIYASEALFMAGIHPRRAAGRVALPRYELLVAAIRNVLSSAIRAGGTTLRDFYGGDGEAGYFRQQLEAYGREGEACRRCNTPISAIVQGQRSTFYCKNCQT